MITTDTSLIEISGYIHKTDSFDHKFKFIKEKYNNKDLIKLTSYHIDSITISCIYYTDRNGNKKGVLNAYDEYGKLKVIFNYDNNSWLYAEPHDYPNFPILNLMKQKGDSVARSLYGSNFFEKHIKWNMESSNYFNKNCPATTANSDWQNRDSVDAPGVKCHDFDFPFDWARENQRLGATEFNIAYDLYYEGKRYEKAICIIIDEKGSLLNSHKWNRNWTIYNTGLEKIRDTSLSDLPLSFKEALKLAYECDLDKKDSTQVYSYIQWKSIKNDTEKVFNGNFRVVLSRNNPRTKKEKSKHPYAMDYTEWIFNPWTKELIEKRNVYRTEAFDRIFGENKKYRRKRR